MVEFTIQVRIKDNTTHKWKQKQLLPPCDLYGNELTEFIETAKIELAKLRNAFLQARAQEG